jgi:hypothetical protein
LPSLACGSRPAPHASGAGSRRRSPARGHSIPVDSGAWRKPTQVDVHGFGKWMSTGSTGLRVSTGLRRVSRGSGRVSRRYDADLRRSLDAARRRRRRVRDRRPALAPRRRTGHGMARAGPGRRLDTGARRGIPRREGERPWTSIC